MRFGLCSCAVAGEPRPSWAALLADASPSARATLAAPEVLPHLVRDLAAARTAWPGAAAISDAALIAAVVQRLGMQKDPAAAFARLRLDDLLLALWCATGDARAISAFEQAHKADLDGALARFRRLAVTGDELRQLLRIKLFVASAGRAPRIADYSGFGFLQNWLRVTALRALVDLARTERARKVEELLADDELLGLPALGPDLAAKYARDEVSRAIKRAFAAAVAGLAPRQRNFLRHAQVDALTLDQIAALYGIHRATVARTLAQARTELADATRRTLAETLGVDAESIDSVVRAADSRIDLSLSRVLAAPALAEQPGDVQEDPA